MLKNSYMKRLTSVVLIAGMLVNGNFAMAADVNEESISDSSESIEINSVNDLEKISENLDGNYILMENLDLSGTEWKSIGTNMNPFTGKLDGNGRTIYGLSLDSSSGSEGFIGLFGVIDNAEIFNLAVDQSTIAINEEGQIYAGMIAGKIQNSVLEDCYAGGDILIESDAAYCTGGIAGILVQNADSTAEYTYNMSHCVSNVQVDTEYTNGDFGHLQDIQRIQHVSWTAMP